MNLDPGMVASSIQGTILRLHDIYSWNYHEIADCFDITASEACRRYHDAIKKATKEEKQRRLERDRRKRQEDKENLGFK